MRDTVAFLRDPAAFTAGPGLRLGDFYRVRTPGLSLHVVTDPQLVEQILVSQADCFDKSRVYWQELRESFGESIGSLEGESWEYLHRTQRPFFTPRAVQDYLPTVEALSGEAFDRLARRVATHATVPLLDVFAELNARIVLAVLFGDKNESDPMELARRIEQGHAIIAWKSRFPWRRMQAAVTNINARAEDHKEYFGAVADRLRRSAAASDPRLLLRALLKVHGDPNAPCYPESLLRNEVTFHLGAGTETQAAAAGWALYLMRRDEQVLERVRAEIASIAGDDPVESRHMPGLTYTKQALLEVLRLYPPVYALLRDCVRTVELANQTVQARQTFLISILGIQRNPRLWHNADRFDPDRFNPERSAAHDKYQYLPFGAGKHVCIGQHLALPALTLTIARFIQRFEWTFDGTVIRPVARPTLKPSRPFDAWLKVRPSH
jgi:cytochrome P450